MWVDPGATAFDVEDGDITESIRRDASELDTTKPGVYRVTYSVVDAKGCVAQAVRYVRVIAIVVTSDAVYLSQLCVRQVPMATLTCERGMHRNTDHLPNPAAFPACCLVVSEMDSAGCFCDGTVIGELNAQNETFFNTLLDFTPMACGFKIKTGAVCTDIRALERFIADENKGVVVWRNDTAATVEDLITEGGALNDDLPCDAQVEAATAMCRRLTQTSAGPAPLVADFVPCCTAVSMLDASQCLCEVDVLSGDRLTFLQQLVGFAPLGCGFALTANCPEVYDKLEPPSIVFPDAFAGAAIPEVRPIAGSSNVTTWEMLTSPSSTTTVPSMELVNIIDGENKQLFRLATCSEYMSMVPEVCGMVRLYANVSTFALTACCAFLHAAHARGCLCPPAGIHRLNIINPDLELISPVACALRLDAQPQMGLEVCKTSLTLEQVMSPAQTIAAGPAEAGKGEESTSDGFPADFFDTRNITLASLADVADEATPIIVTTATTLTLMDNETDGEVGITLASEHEIPLGSVIGVISVDVLTDLEEMSEVEQLPAVKPFAVFEPGATYAIPSGAILGSNVTSAFTFTEAAEDDETAGAAFTAVTVGGNDRVVVTIPDLNGTVEIPWVASLTPVPLIEEANYRDDSIAQLPITVATNPISGVTKLIPIFDDDDETNAEIYAAEGDKTDGGLIYGTGDDTGLGEIIPSSTSSCLFSVIVAEASCIPILESVSEVFELDLGWRVCCARIAAVNEDLCYCDGAVAAALDISSRSAIHARIMDAVPGACDFQITTGDQCPTALFTPTTFESEGKSATTAVNVTTSTGSSATGDGSPSTIVSVETNVYLRPDIVSSVTASGGVVVAETNMSQAQIVADDEIKMTEDVITIIEPTQPTLKPIVVLMPQQHSGGESAADITPVMMTGDGVVSYQSAILPGVNMKVNGTDDRTGTTVLFSNGTVTRVTNGGPTDTFSTASVSALPRGALEANVEGDTAEVSLSPGRADGSVTDFVSNFGLDATYDAAADLVTITLPDGTTITADATALNSKEPDDLNAPDPVDAQVAVATVENTISMDPMDPNNPSRPLPGYGVVVLNGDIVPSLALNDEVGTGPCDAVRKLKNFLTTSLEPGMETFVVMGAVSHCEPDELSVAELTLPIMYRPRGTTDGYAPPLSPPTVECLGLSIISRFGNTLRDNLCDNFSYEVRDYGLDIRISDLSVCVDCALTGRGLDGALFRIAHSTPDTLNAMQPRVMTLECDLSTVEDQSRRHLLRLPEKMESSVSMSEYDRLTAAARHRRHLAQFGISSTYSNPIEVNDFFGRTWTLGGENGEEKKPESKYGLVGDNSGSGDWNDSQGWNQPQSGGDDGSGDEVFAPPQDANQEQRPSPALSDCDEDVGRLVNNVQWWSRGAGPLEPGIPNEPYKEYIFAGSLDALEGGEGNIDLTRIVLPILFSPWVLETSQGGDWRPVLDPANELEVVCDRARIEYPSDLARPDNESDASAADNNTCDGLAFALSAYSPPTEEQGTGQETGSEGDAPSVILLEVTFPGIRDLCPGCRVVGSGGQFGLFRVRHKLGASLDFVGPTVGALECTQGSLVGTTVRGCT